jgi:hypothetical protein
MEKIIYVVDKYNSALHTAAASRIKLGGGEILFANQYKSPLELLKRIDKEFSGIVLFCWRKALIDVLYLKKAQDYYKEIKNRFTIIFLIPDHLGFDLKNGVQEFELIKASDSYLVTNRILYHKYSERYLKMPPAAIYHDLPNLDAIEKVINNTPKKDSSKKRVIWIGNSRWGNRQGAYDHKGFKSIIKPLQRLIHEHGDCFDFIIIDSHKASVDNLEVLTLIRNCDILLQVSKSEGTGLPILEAAGLETNILTTPVGIVPEFFKNTEFLLQEKSNAEMVHAKLHSNFHKDLGVSLRSQFEFYVKSISAEKLPKNKRHIELPKSKRLRDRVLIHMYWLYRYLVH